MVVVELSTWAARRRVNSIWLAAARQPWAWCVNSEIRLWYRRRHCHRWVQCGV